MAATITVKCLQCGTSTKVSASAAGKKGKCPVCGKIIAVPDPKKAGDSLLVNEDLSNEEIKKVARQVAAGAGVREVKKKGFLSKLFGK